MLKWYVSFFVHKIRRIVLATEASLEHLFIIIIMSPSIGGALSVMPRSFHLSDCLSHLA